MYPFFLIAYPPTIICIAAPRKKLAPNVVAKAGSIENSFFTIFDFSINGLRAASNLGTSPLEDKLESKSHTSDKTKGFLYPLHTSDSAQKYTN